MTCSIVCLSCFVQHDFCEILSRPLQVTVHRHFHCWAAVLSVGGHGLLICLLVFVCVVLSLWPCGPVSVGVVAPRVGLLGCRKGVSPVSEILKSRVCVSLPLSLPPFLFLSFETGSHYVVLAVLKLTM